MGHSQNTTVLWPNWPTFLLIYWFDNMFRSPLLQPTPPGIHPSCT